MKKFLVLFAMIACLSVSATAQDVKPFSLYLGAGISMPNGDFSNEYKLGLHATAGVGLKLAPGFQAVPKAEFHTFSLDKDALMATQILTSVDGGSLSGLLLGADLRFAPPVPAAPVKPFLFGGGGWARLSSSDLTYEIGGVTVTDKFEAANKLFWNIGAGIEFGGSPMLGFFVQARYLSITTDDVNYNSIPITAGIKF